MKMWSLRYMSALLDWHHALATLPPEEDHPHPLDSKFGGPQNWSGPYGENKYLLSLLGIELWQSIAILTHVLLALKSFRNWFIIQK
jgi:hypothetical protein